MKRPLFAAAVRTLAALVALVLAAGSAQAQLNLGEISGGLQGGAAPQSPVTVSAQVAPPQGDQPTRLLVTADVATGWHIYSLTQKRGGPVPSKIVIDAGTGFKLAGDFTPAVPPDRHPEPAFNNLPVETHDGKTVWSAPLELSPGVDPATLSITGKLSFQACDASSCLPPTTLKFAASLNPQGSVAPSAPAAAPTPLSSPAAGYKGPASHLFLKGEVEPKVAAPGSKVRLKITAEPEAGWHLYELADHDPHKVAKPTLIVLNQTAGWQVSPIVADGQVVETASAAAPGERDRFYEHPVTFTIELAVPAGTQSGDYRLGGMMGYQTCRASACDIPQGVAFEVTVPVAAETVAGSIPLAYQPLKSYKEVADAAARTTTSEAATGFDTGDIQPTTDGGSDSLIAMLGFALLGGLILNVMPCVLPVIGLKILAFVEQSHQSRHRIFILNIWFTAGLLSVFVVLASLAVFLHLGWGEQFNRPWFTIGMAGMVFAMALSFLGFWEIPIPGFVGSGSASTLAAKEGPGGAFAKGVFTTLLATPCSGPFLGSLFGLLLRQPPAVVYAVFLCVGLGMASPYLLIGAFPRLIHFLPRPGAWMDTFKQLMGFVLLATVVFLFMSIKHDYVIPSLAMLVGIWFACWWVGRTPLTAEIGAKLTAWGGGLVIATAVGFFAFNWLTPGPDVLPWQPFSRTLLTKLTSEGKTVFIDFTAEWCLTCKANERIAINTRDVRDLVDEYGIVPLKADWTDGSEEIKETLHLLGRNSIPVYAVFPADRPNHPIVFSDLVTKGQVLAKLREGGRSKTGAELTALKSGH